MRLPSAPPRYDAQNEDAMRQFIEQELDRMRADMANAFLANGGALLLRSPNGTKYKVTVDNTGTLVVTAY
jgi:hypothetical protein